MRGSPFVSGGRGAQVRPCDSAGGSVGPCRSLVVRGARSVSQVPPGDLRRGGRAGARHRAAADRAGGRPDQPRLSVLRPARLRQDVQRPHPGPLAELRRRARRRTRAGSARRASRWRPRVPGSLDVVELDAASHGGVDDTRDLRDRAFYMPAESRYRVFIIDEAHMVTTQGFNALLKIVEEPPEHLVFIFATTEPDKVLTTIRSRTHHYPFRLIPPTTLRTLLERLCAEEGVRVEPAVFPLVIRAGGGSARDSLSMLDQLLAGAGPGGRHLPQRGRPARRHRRRAAGRDGRRARRRRRRLGVRRGRQGGRGRPRPAPVRRRPAAAVPRPGDPRRRPGRRAPRG